MWFNYCIQSRRDRSMTARPQGLRMVLGPLTGEQGRRPDSAPQTALPLAAAIRFMPQATRLRLGSPYLWLDLQRLRPGPLVGSSRLRTAVHLQAVARRLPVIHLAVVAAEAHTDRIRLIEKKGLLRWVD